MTEALLRAKIRRRAILRRLQQVWRASCQQMTRQNYSQIVRQMTQYLSILSPEELIEIVDILALREKIEHILRWKGSGQPNYWARATRGLFDKQSKPLMLAFAAFVQLCNIRQHQAEVLTPGQILKIERLKTELQRSFLDGEMFAELVRRKNVVKNGILSHQDVDPQHIRNYIAVFGWVTLLECSFNAGTFNSIPFRVY